MISQKFCAGLESEWTVSFSSLTPISLGHIWWVFRSNQSFPWAGWQNPCGAEQSRPGGHSAADAGLWCADVVRWGRSSILQRVGEGLSRLFLGQTSPKCRQPASVWSWNTRSLQRHPEFCPRNAALRKLNDLIKRARLAKVRVLTSHRSSPLRLLKCIKWCILCLSYNFIIW